MVGPRVSLNFLEVKKIFEGNVNFLPLHRIEPKVLGCHVITVPELSVRITDSMSIKTKRWSVSAHSAIETKK
jgi:hypothetical protein